MTARVGLLRSRTYYVCYNQVSYVVACEHALCNEPARATLLVDSLRVVAQPRYTQILAHRPLSRWQTVVACAHGIVQPIAVYVPHRRFGWLLRTLSRLASSRGLVDDGLDTLRERPKNIDVDSLADFQELLTFEDYERLGSWTIGLPVSRACALSRLVEDIRPALPESRARALVVQSPGVDPRSAALKLGMPPGEVLVLLHGNPKKRQHVPPEYPSQSTFGYSIERTVLAFDGPILTGETMVTIVALHLKRHPKLVVELSASQYANLKCLHERLANADVRLILHRSGS